MSPLSELWIVVASVLIGLSSFSPAISNRVKRSNTLHPWLMVDLRIACVASAALVIAGMVFRSSLVMGVADTLLVIGLTIALAIAVIGRLKPAEQAPNQDILVVAAHPDDLEIACGATVAKLVDLGYRVRALIIADGKDGGNSDGRATEARRGADFLGLTSMEMLQLPDRELEHHQKEMIAFIEDAIARYEPELILTHSRNDVHQDHVAVHYAVCRAGRHHRSILCFESPSVTSDFKPTVFIDVDEYPTVKNAAIEAHSSQTAKPYMNEEVIESIMKFRGRQGRIPRAEGFEAVRLHLTEPIQLRSKESDYEVSR